MLLTLENILPDEDYAFQVRFEQGTVAGFFGRSSEHEKLISERRHWLDGVRSQCVAMLPGAEPMLEETLDIADSIAGGTGIAKGLNPAEKLLKLGEHWEPDFLLLRPDAEGLVRLFAGCVCFPSYWSLEEKIGRPIEEIHDPVPGMNAAIGPRIHRFLSRMKPNVAWLRSNWGLSRSPELNQHPSRRLQRLDASVSADEVWLRVENQALVALPGSGGILFGIRIVTNLLSEIVGNRSLAGRLARSLKTMPEEVAVYKRIAAARLRLLEILSV